jgi:hypothetical protein
VLANLSLGYGVAATYVLCIGQQGHVAVEKAGHDHERDMRDPSHALHAAGSAEAEWKSLSAASIRLDSQWSDLPGPCLDLPIDAGDQALDVMFETLLHHLVKTGAPFFAVVFCFIFVVPLAVLQSPPLAETNPVSSTPALRRCVVLLI